MYCDYIHQFISQEYYIINLTLIIICVTYICNILILFQFFNLVLMVKQRYSHLNKRLSDWISGTFNWPICLNNGTKGAAKPTGLLIK